MRIRDTLFSRRQLGELAGLDASTLTYWTREGMLRPAQGGGGKGLHRKFAHSEVNLAAILMELSRCGVSAIALRALAKKFHDAMDWFEANSLTRETTEACGHLVACHDEWVSTGHIELDDVPQLPNFDAAWPKRQSRDGKGTVRVLTWEQAVVQARGAWPGLISDGIIEVATTTSEAEWRLTEAYFDAITRVPNKRQRRRSKPAAWPESLLCFMRLDDGDWTIARDPEEAIEFGRFTAIDLSRLHRSLWGDEASGGSPS